MEHPEAECADPRCIVFDLDGTLIDSRRDIANAVNMMRAYYNLEALPLQTVVSYIGNGVSVLLERALAGSGISPLDAKEIMNDCYVKNLNLESRLYPGVYKGLAELKKKSWKIALLSNKPDDFCKFILYDFGIGSFFDIIIGGSEDFPMKPDPAALISILSLFNISDPKNAWMAGDNYTDLEAGLRAGMKTAFCAYGFGSAKNFVCDLTVTSFKELIERIDA